MSSNTGVQRQVASVRRFLDMKRDGQRIVAMTAYDVLFARFL